MLMLHPSISNSIGCLSATTVCSKPQHWFINFYMVILLAILHHPCLLAATPTVPGVVILIVNTLQFLLSTPLSTSQSNTLAIVFHLMLPGFGMVFLMINAVQHLLSLSGKTENSPFCKSLSTLATTSPLYLLGMTLLWYWTFGYLH